MQILSQIFSPNGEIEIPFQRQRKKIYFWDINAQKNVVTTDFKMPCCVRLILDDPSRNFNSVRILENH